MTIEATYSANDPLRVFKDLEMQGKLNVADDTVAAQIAAAVRRQHCQLPPYQPNAIRPERVCLLGGGPSLEETLPELLDLLRAGALLVTTNGAYRWALEHHLTPNAQVVLDARPGSARFVQPDLPNCRYYLASQCHPDVWDAVEGRPRVCIWHGVNPEVPSEAKGVLDEYYLGQWQAVANGTTVGIRAITLLRMLGYVRFDLFGMDGCWQGDAHHAFPQAENDADARFGFAVHPEGHPELRREFCVSGWHVQQLQDFIQLVFLNGQHFLLTVHGDGLLAYALHMYATVDAPLVTT